MKNIALKNQLIGIVILVCVSATIIIAGEPNKTAPICNTTVLRDIQYGTIGDVNLYMNIVLPSPAPKKPVPVIMFIHGGGWQEGTREHGMAFAKWCAESEYIGATVEYRLTQQAPFPAQLQDCKCAVRFLRANAKKYMIDPCAIGVWGASAGGHLAAMLGLTDGIAEFEGSGGWPNISSSVQAVCDWFGPTDLALWVQTEQRFGNDPNLCKPLGFPLETPQRVSWARNFGNDPGLVLLLGATTTDRPDRAKWASPISYVQKSINTPPFLIMHGDQDSWVPYQQSIILAEALDKKSCDVTFIMLINSDHGLGRFTTAWPNHVKPFFDRVFGRNQSLCRTNPY